MTLSVRIAAVAAWALVSVAGSALGQPTPDPPPGAIHLLLGYAHETQEGIDTRVGRIWKVGGGPEVHYDIGHLAGNHAKGEGPRLWSKTQIIGGHPFRLRMLTESKLVLTFEDDTANFFVSGIHTQEDLAEVLLMLVSYTPYKR